MTLVPAVAPVTGTVTAMATPLESTGVAGVVTVPTGATKNAAIQQSGAS